MLDELYEFGRAYGRSPTSWRDFRYGVAQLARSSARDALGTFEAVRAAQGTEADAKQWHREMRTRAGY